MTTSRMRTHHRAFRPHPVAWALLCTPLVIWAGVGVAHFFVITAEDLQLSRTFAYVSLGVGATLIGGVSSIAFLLACLIDASDDLGDDEDEDEDEDEGLYVEDPRTLVPCALIPIWEEIASKFDDAEFATWIISQADASQSEDDLWRSAEAKHAVWEGAHPRYDTARHEAGHAVVGIALGQIPVWAIARDDAENDGYDGATLFHDRYPRIDPIQDSWDDLRIAAAGFARQVRGSDPYSGVDVDIDRMRSEALELVAFGRRPMGYTGEMTVDALVREAVDQAEAILDTHADAVEAISQALMAKDELGGFELRALFDQPHRDQDRDQGSDVSA